jgi:hypothetical protein
MVTSYPQSISADHGVSRDAVRDDGPAARAWDRVRQAMCGLHGHDRLVHFEQDRMFLRCVSCGHETPGWEMGELRRPAATARVERVPRHMPQLLGERKIA